MHLSITVNKETKLILNSVLINPCTYTMQNRSFSKTLYDPLLLNTLFQLHHKLSRVDEEEQQFPLS